MKKLDHVVIATADLEDSLAQWARNVGLKTDASLNQPLGSGFKVSRLPIGESFLELVQNGYVERRVAREYAPTKDALEMALRGIGVSTSSLNP